MIRVTRLDKHEVAINCDLIESVDARPDTTIRLVTGQSFVVRETVDEILGRIREWRTSLLRGAGAGSLVAGSLTSVLHPELEGTLRELADGAPDEGDFAA